eukprot:TRINITY_DN12255_c0_g2_i1.p1 TRINITY_DN12255_c0_g2~~TRINITY_DN12255_c0_g2_i1.p1  ORF type:complete len:328 (-),score=7.85 TRINITY_DN12255_c0_g2_i1:171-1154(-)
MARNSMHDVPDAVDSYSHLTALSIQLSRQEALLNDLHWLFVGRWHNWPDSSTSAEPPTARDVPRPDEQGPPTVEPGVAPKTPSKSKRRRQRAAATQRRYWNLLAGEMESAGDSSAEKEPAMKRGRSSAVTQPSPSCEGGPQKADNWTVLLAELSSPSFLPEVQTLLLGTTGTDDGSETLCQRCRASECKCIDVLCKACWKDLTSCSCAVPLVRSCSICGARYDIRVDICTACGENPEGDLVTNFIGTANECEICGTFENQSEIWPCDGALCAGAGEDNLPFMAHAHCMARTPHPDYPEGAMLCPACLSSGVGPYVADEDSDDASESN